MQFITGNRFANVVSINGKIVGIFQTGAVFISKGVPVTTTFGVIFAAISGQGCTQIILVIVIGKVIQNDGIGRSVIENVRVGQQII